MYATNVNMMRVTFDVRRGDQLFGSCDVERFVSAAQGCVSLVVLHPDLVDRHFLKRFRTLVLLGKLDHLDALRMKRKVRIRFQSNKLHVTSAHFQNKNCTHTHCKWRLPTKLTQETHKCSTESIVQLLCTKIICIRRFFLLN